MPKVFNQDRGVILKGALTVMGISIKEAAIAIGKETEDGAAYVRRVLNDDTGSVPIITAVTRYVIEQATSQGSDVVLNMIDWADELELDAIEESGASGAEAA